MILLILFVQQYLLILVVYYFSLVSIVHYRMDALAKEKQVIVSINEAFVYFHNFSSIYLPRLICRFG